MWAPIGCEIENGYKCENYSSLLNRYLLQINELLADNFKQEKLNDL